MFLSVRRALKGVAGSLCGFSGARSLGSSLTVFVYHDVAEDPSEFSALFRLNVHPKVFDYQIGFIRNNFNIIGPDDLTKPVLPPRAALITFDDGFRSFFTNALPVLERYEVPAVIFLNMEAISGGVLLSGLIAYLCMKESGFMSLLEESSPASRRTRPAYLYCTRGLVDSYIKGAERRFHEEASVFAGRIASLEDVARNSDKGLVYYGNHLFNHDVPMLLSDEELLRSYESNARELRRYPNYREIFSFPFGQPGTCFSAAQADMLLKNGAMKVFSSSGRINREREAPCLDRIALGPDDDSAGRIWFQVFKEDIREMARWAD